MKKHMWAYARQMLHAFAEAGQPAAAHELQLLMGPNGALVWTEAYRVDRSQSFAEDTVTIAPRSPERISHEPLVGVDRSTTADSDIEVPADRTPEPAGVSS